MKNSQLRFTVLILGSVSLNHIFIFVNQMYQFEIEDKNIQNQVTDSVLLRYSYYQEPIPCMLSIINYALYFTGINLMLNMASQRYYKLHTITPKSKTSSIILGVKLIFFCGSLATFSYIIFDFLTANIIEYPYEKLKFQLKVFSFLYFSIGFYAVLAEFCFNLMMIRTVIYSMKNALVEKVQQRAKLKMISLLVFSIILEIIAGFIFVNSGQMVVIKFISTVPSFTHLIISTMLLEMLKNISQLIKEASKKRPLQNPLATFDNKNFCDYHTGESGISGIPDVSKQLSNSNLVLTAP
ncbi:hypothetical protein HDU92_002873 [Lobulomyces angularis]|nr:hypothetical protein HDU92_002873 [Lobulomyces angularis]